MPTWITDNVHFIRPKAKWRYVLPRDSCAGTVSNLNACNKVYLGFGWTAASEVHVFSGEEGQQNPVNCLNVEQSSNNSTCAVIGRLTDNIRQQAQRKCWDVSCVRQNKRETETDGERENVSLETIGNPTNLCQNH